MSTSMQRRGIFFLLGAALIEGAFPIIAKLASSIFPPIFFVGAASGIACCTFGVLAYLNGSFTKAHAQRKVVLYAIGVACFVLTSFVCIFIGSRYTSGVNVSLLIQMEIIFAFLYTTFFVGEQTSVRQICGIFAVLLGTVVILYNGTIHLNKGDVLVIVASALFPIGNIFAKKALALSVPTIVLFFRYAFGSVALLGISFFIEQPSHVIVDISLQQWYLLLTYGLLVLTLSKVLWYSGLQVLPIGQSTYIIASSPMYSLLFAYFILHEVPSVYQWFGFVVSIIGVYAITKLSLRTQS